ncbi:S-layer homology domain-containing protein [Paenibacillus pasadenensis]|uniref:S-layer homology domain-containing protein n=1 Tax=Paenibacillus TaxID=44249 RepID=UPI0004196DF8|nr:S-layer homology domain-containing protein [Paenibacillus pasadenensis]
MRTNLWTWSLSLLLIFMLLPVSPAAASDEPAFYVGASKSSVAVGDQVEVEIGVRGAQAWTAFELNLSFDAALWSVSASSFTTGLSGFSAVVNPELLDEGQLRAVYTKLGHAAGDSGDLMLGKVKFTAKAAGSGAFSLNAIKVGQDGDRWTDYAPGVRTSTQIVSGGGGDSGPAPVIPDAGNDPVISGSGISVKAAPNAAGTARVELDAARLQSAIGKLEGHALTIKLVSDPATKQVELVLPFGPIRSAMASNVERLTIDNGLAVVSLDRSWFAKQNAADGAKLQLSVGRKAASELPAAASGNVPADATIYDFGLTLDGRPVGAFDAREVTVTVPYTLRAGEQPEQAVIYYIADNGELEVVKNAKYDPATGMISFSPRHFSLYFPGYADLTFRDLNEAGWAKPYIKALAAREAVTGVGGEAFDPNGRLTRAQFITMLVRLFDLTDPAAAATFSDAKKGAWYYEAIASAQKAGIVEGKKDGTIGIGDPISRQDMAVMLYRASRYMKLDVLAPANAAAPSFADQDKIAGYAKEAAAAVEQAGLMNGMGGGVFDPLGLSSRAQAAAVLYRLFEIKEWK